ncbi:uncharacterized protein Z520_11055 [Fonsecaea multimorphosa CBS 102226]|uniref:Nuclear pore complex protein Nup85 n=1 Tax=Fonsecaea multimorphosa CBS 102226 TaxID=1442371 RepID=A0A0D2I7M0_9EURO|nr:uncharacterized protein Z520_11055 [Fonsecaea multimorphosa CBS 102226]KIX93201.1 hypothetical protein Z520_11055 [Fonsecaea multimorphosa CBS 102226]OAL18438.1 hypothetical protein AYO22_10634 [Fonsecaea multimorphosa]
MNKFSADYSSSVNSTPGRTPAPRGSNFLSSNPPQLASTTPIAPPPSQIFGSSAFGTGVSKLQLSKPTKSPPLRSSPNFQHPPRTKNGTPQISSRARRAEYNDEEEDEDQDMDEDEYEDEPSQFRQSRGFRSIDQRQPASLMKFSTMSTRDSRMTAPRKSFRNSTRLSALPHKGNDTVVLDLARDMGARARPASLTEADEVILETEQILRELDEQCQYLKDSANMLQTIAEYAYSLIKEWQRFVEPDRPSLDTNDIGPQPTSPAFAKANYLASLLLVLRHPPPSPDNIVIPTPRVLLDWLDNYHVSYDQMYRAVASARPNCTSHDLFWDAVQSLTLRGKLQQVMQLFADADFKYAASAVDDGADGVGYKGAQLQTVQSVIYRARILLNSCPAIQSGDWNVAGPDWDVFRTAVEAALDNLTDEVTGQDEDEYTFEAENFGLRRPEMNLLGRTAQKSASTLPWTIFQNLKILYSILLGSAEEIAAQSQDWLEAATSLTIWWDGTADAAAVAQWSFDVSRANNLTKQDEDFNPYLGRLRDAFLSVTDPNDKNSFQINAMSPVEVGLGCVLQGSTQGALTVLRTLSQCIASSVAEIGAKAGWLEEEIQARPTGLNEEDLMVLSYGAPKQGVSKDELLLSYAKGLFEKATLHLPDGSSVEGWEVSISVVTRLDDREAMHTAVSNFLEQLQVTTQDRTEKLTNLCSDLGLQDEARKVSDRFGDYLVNNTEEYGTALLCYARSHASHKIRQLIDVLVSYALVQSRAYPPENDMDDGLRSLVGNPKTALIDIAEVDPEAAEMLQFSLVGYACLRRFYTLRDEESRGGATTNSRPLARRRAAARALVAAINSAADSIYGGLYDPERQSAIQVDGLLTLLGEATALLSRSQGGERTKIFTTEQIYALLAAIEDLSTVSERVYTATEECLAASLREYHGSRPPSPRAVLKKSMSSGSGSGFSYSLMGSEMLGRSMTTDMTSASGSGVLVGGSQGQKAKGKEKKGAQEERGWDWRDRFPGEDVRGGDIVKVLRMGLAEELSLAELDEGVVF